MNPLILIATRRCTQRCVYCPVEKEKWPRLSAEDVREALRWFSDKQGGGKVKIFGGEPLLAPNIVRTTIDYAANHPRISSVNLCSNGALLNDKWLDYLEEQPKVWLTLSLDGMPQAHRKNRPILDGSPDPLSSIEKLLPRLRHFPRLMVTQVFAPETVASAGEGFRYLLSQGFRRFNLMPASYVYWSDTQIGLLKTGFQEIAEVVKGEWRSGRPLYLRNLFVRNTQPTFASGAVIDVDGNIFPSDCILANLSKADRDALQCGSVQSPPEQRELEDRAAIVPDIVGRYWPVEILRSTAAVDVLLDSFCQSLIRDFVIYRKNRSTRPARSLTPNQQHGQCHA